MNCFVNGLVIGFLTALTLEKKLQGEFTDAIKDRLLGLIKK